MKTVNKEQIEQFNEKFYVENHTDSYTVKEMEGIREKLKQVGLTLTQADFGKDIFYIADNGYLCTTYHSDVKNKKAVSIEDLWAEIFEVSPSLEIEKISIAHNFQVGKDRIILRYNEKDPGDFIVCKNHSSGMVQLTAQDLEIFNNIVEQVFPKPEITETEVRKLMEKFGIKEEEKDELSILDEITKE